MHKPLTQFQEQTWIELIKLIKQRLAHNSQKHILYGDLAEAIFGKRHGGQAFAGSLHQIYVRTKDYNKRNRTKHPRLNSLVFNTQGKQPGIPEYQDPKKIWSILHANGPLYLDRLGVLLGYKNFADGTLLGNGRTGERKSKDSTGSNVGGTRSAAVWQARHSPFVKELAASLDALNWETCSGDPWQPDIVRRHKSSGHSLIVEVKPSISTHDIITAIGQIVCYRTPFKDVTGVIAAPGTSKLQKNLKSVLDRYQIKHVDLDGDIKKQLQAIHHG